GRTGLWKREVRSMKQEARSKKSEIGASYFLLLTSYFKSYLLVDRNLDNFFLDCVGHQLRLVVNVEFAHEVEFVGFHRLYAEPQYYGNVFDRIAFRQQL